MGIKGLTALIADLAPAAIKEVKIEQFNGRKVAIDASMSMYQFMIAIRSNGDVLTNSAGDVTSHLVGMFSRTIRFLEAGMKPLYVFDGKPPQMKRAELEERRKKREEAQVELTAAKETGDQDEIDKFTKRMVTVTKDQTEECKRLLLLMGMPVVHAPCEAEAQCAELCKAGRVFCTATEDADALTFGTPLLARHLNISESRKVPVVEIHLDKVLSGMDISMAQFIDLCILCGCDYTDKIKGIGPKTAYDLIVKHKAIEAVLENLTEKQLTGVPERFLFLESRNEFMNPEVTAASDVPEFVWKEPDEAGLVSFLCTEKQFDEKRVRTAVTKIRASRKNSQGRIDGFFSAVKRPVDENSSNVSKKAKPIVEVKKPASKGFFGKKK